MKSLKETKLRLLQMHYESGVGHIGGNLSCIDILYALYSGILTPADSFVLSKGHAAGAYYTILWATGVFVDADLKSFHKDGGLPGHVINTGSLGHGLSIAAGEALHRKLWNKPGTVYCLTSDGEWDEGSNWEALKFIMDHKLNVKIIIDWNGLQGFKTVDRPLYEQLRAHCPNIGICDGHIISDLAISIQAYTLTLARTVKGNGLSFLSNKLSSHYEPLTKEQYELACKEIESA